MKKNVITIIIASVLLVIFVLLLFTFQVRQSEVVVVSRFLEPKWTINQPGLYLKWPWPIDSINRFDQRVQTFEDQFSETYLADHSILLTSVYVGWRISDARAFFPKFPGGSAVAAQRTLQTIVGSAKSKAMGDHDLADLVNSDPSKLKFDEIEREIRTAVEAQLAQNHYGISIEFLGIKRIGLPESVTQSVFTRMKAERNKYVTQAQSEGDNEANEIKSDAKRQADNLVADANAQALRIEGEGETEAAKLLGVFQQNPQLAVFELQLDALKSSMNQKSTLIFDERWSPFSLFQSLPSKDQTK
ncbi:MAG TPA: protease modulator HflC [Candidatus Acidoferrales bacterium]|nr:protease modulator HflC [Candidatus Acidoferrales bacterium]